MPLFLPVSCTRLAWIRGK